MKIWIISRSYPTKQNKWRGSFELEQAKLLAKHGHSVCLLAVVFHPVNKINKWGSSLFTDEGVSVYVESIPYFPERMHIHLTRFQGRIWEILLSKVETEQGVPDIIHVHYPAMVSIPGPVLRYKGKGVKLVITEHWSQTMLNTMDDYQRRQLKKYTDQSDAIICVSKLLEEAVKKITNTSQRIYIIPNVVPNQFYEPCRSHSKEYEFVTVGRLEPIKQVDKIVDAFTDIFKGNSAVHLKIIGGGSEFKKIKHLIEKRGVKSTVLLTGAISHKAVADELSSANAIICFSKWETFGVPIVEAWAHGVPAIVADSVGCAEEWDDSLGILIPANDSESLRNAMLEMYREYKRFNPEYMKNYALGKYSEEAVYNKIIMVYKRILDNAYMQ